ncbi:lyase family protein [Marmoricola endophyticus]|uniref:lyase family protein n=1 Tax=Marmoricola endophyticus TaxID=2040280 RepID=UPI001666A2E7|nr:lyase family protein [Marmoricola endophyticus]
MSDLFWPGDARAGSCCSEASYVAAMVQVERAWLAVLADAGLTTAAPLPFEGIAAGTLDAESAGNPVLALVSTLRDLSGNSWVHRGLTSQDVVDTALVLLLREAVATVREHLRAQVTALVGVVRDHRGTPLVLRTLTQPALPGTVGGKAAGWLHAVLDLVEELDALVFPVQLGGAAGTMAAAVELGLDPAAARAGLASRLGLADARAWHTDRAPVTRVGDALVRCTDAWGRIASDVLALTRLGLLSEGAGGGSSTMPGKANPVRSVLLRRAAIAAPGLASTLHLSAALQVDERADGAWHAEWDTLRLLARRTVVAAAHADDLLTGLVVHAGAASADLDAHDVRGEQRAMADLAGHPPAPTYLGETDRLVDDALARAEEHR